MITRMGRNMVSTCAFIGGAAAVRRPKGALAARDALRGEGFFGEGISPYCQRRRASCTEVDASTVTAMLGKGFGGFARPKFKYTGNVRPGKQSPPRSVPQQIERPDYAADGKPKAKLPAFPWEVEVKSADDIEAMRVSGRLAREVLDAAGAAVKPGITTDEIDAIVHQITIERGAYPSPLNYKRFPKSCCTSINEVICHGIPDSTKLKSGDIVNVDVTVFYGGFHGDCSETFLVGDVDEEGKRLMKVTHECLQKAMDICKPGVPYYEIGNTIQKHADEHGLTVVRDFVGHGIGRTFHTTPNVLHHRNREPNGVMRVGHVFTIEPMINEGSVVTVFWPDEWTATTRDGRRSAQFEHTLLLTEKGVEVLTPRTAKSVPFFWEQEQD